MRLAARTDADRKLPSSRALPARLSTCPQYARVIFAVRAEYLEASHWVLRMTNLYRCSTWLSGAASYENNDSSWPTLCRNVFFTSDSSSAVSCYCTGPGRVQITILIMLTLATLATYSILQIRKWNCPSAIFRHYLSIEMKLLGWFCLYSDYSILMIRHWTCWVFIIVYAILWKAFHVSLILARVY